MHIFQFIPLIELEEIGMLFPLYKKQCFINQCKLTCRKEKNNQYTL